jgi:arsenate reductase
MVGHLAAGTSGTLLPRPALRTSSNTMSDITIYHNPKCGTSRNTLAMIRNSGAEPQVIEYLKTPPIAPRCRR